jgi:hypothetical protein
MKAHAFAFLPERGFTHTHTHLHPPAASPLHNNNNTSSDVQDEQKISLSIRFVAQSSGLDLDPNNVQLEQIRRKKLSAPRKRGKIELGAVLNTLCSKCGCEGHLATECWGYGFLLLCYALLRVPFRERECVCVCARARWRTNRW